MLSGTAGPGLLDSFEIFDPMTGLSRVVGTIGGGVGVPHDAFLLPDGKIVLIDGNNINEVDLATDLPPQNWSRSCERIRVG